MENQMASPERRRMSKIGVVTSNKMDKSVVVRVERVMMHGQYKRFIKRGAKFMAHDENNTCNVGDTVEIVETRPLSARKRWRVSRVLRTAIGVGETADAGNSPAE